ncbi:putative membrane protein involved in D-alanine export [Frankia casuarinae]|uniref:Membrane bound O-acyl transferase, MBOAT n=1 Tax=Frankia casuarinae (strain DSM 45818 / CECT 9043 / HFP020203 / CcI3) TaxID=106370 RepID=Q2J631_FRACC|nr:MULTISPECIES: MBOAT family protein [Frankia]ABD13261.1 membrane bound O-acyl transferase, MBOAT [Frankia casuarinae]ETA03867.1 putative membrane protein involved in D-alanine export [Frankia sp. CcI6]EYT93782.1 putative membrane protein involved in D-alanine export [Frankia casuarinae]KDA44426.1 putative membrane protein involved in D-alanine export [Frankia sp. BMG5.23]KEZ37205.1 putative membrane protein involved in D-alanine export [Frankia sp. CeD]
MIFPTIEFAAFLVVVLAISWLLMPRPRLWKPFILGASYFFYGFADARFVLLIVASTLINQGAAVAIHRWRDRRVLIAAIVCDLGLLGWFKYYSFFALSVDRALAEIGLPTALPLLQVALPIGISFFTFQALSYVIDVHRGTSTPASLLDFAVYEAFFPHLVAGPIVRAREFIPQLATPRDPNQVQATRAVFLIVGGLVKKVVLADLIASRLVDPVFDAPGQHSSLEIATAGYGYAVQIYCDFSAYSDIAIGIALLLGFRFPDNFDRPYAAVTLQDFWRRWHMTLSRWLRDYVYLPLGGNRKGQRRTYLNIMITMTLGGLWHGAAWTFVLWGALHGGGLVTERRIRARRADRIRATERARATGQEQIPGRARATGQEQIPGQAESAGLSAMPLPRPGSESPAPLLSAGGSGAVIGPGPAAGFGIAGSSAGTPTTASRRTIIAAQAALPEAVPNPVRAWAGRLAVFHFVCATWVLFRAPDLATARELVVRLFTASGPAPLVTPTVLAAIGVGLATAAVPRVWWIHAQAAFTRLRLGAQIALLTPSIMIIYAIVGPQDVAPFIYFRF